ncbi:uncharacterized protein LOC108200759 isoform X2 [Daucus carota subsp. sativus]|uniref:uncharacterized protein LOC108200759 isoform X2 n=1 Tax=Daucus carota subsp. sativus TaxID=79200 RepID=UPI0007EF1224|nr:PREDICTED: uncharacterized protein LOC108200759 isoform X2 [Daucus carota subsp. sativus]
MVSKEEEFVCGRSRVLHNFKLPSLKWGSRKVMRCMRVDEAAAARCRRSSEGRRVNFRFSPGEKVGFGVEAAAEKMMFDFPAAGEKRRREESEMMKPWNLRTRRARLDPDVREGAKLNSNSNSRARMKERDSSARDDKVSVKVKSPWCLRGSGEKRERERARFSVSLSKDEIEEDFVAITGNRVPRRPKKWPRNVRRQLDMLFPGLWLTEVTADLYKVPDLTVTGKDFEPQSGLFV